MTEVGWRAICLPPALPGKAMWNCSTSPPVASPSRCRRLKWACFVRDFNSGEPSNPERLLRTTFSGRPRLAGLWLRMTLTDETVLEGMAANDLTLLDPGGLLLTPPDTRSNTQRIFLPRTSIAELSVVAVIGATAASPDQAQTAASGSPAGRSLPCRHSKSTLSQLANAGASEQTDRKSGRSGPQALLPGRPVRPLPCGA